MKQKLREYIDTIFADAEGRAPYNERLRELKEEMLQNLYDRYDDLIAKGKTPAAAYNIAVAGVGDISELLDSVVGGQSNAANGAGRKPDNQPPPKPEKRPLNPEEQETVRRYRERSAVITSVAVAMYILCWVPLVILENLMGDVGGSIGLVLMFGMIAGATCAIIHNALSKPKFDANVENWDQDDDDDDDDDDTRRNGRWDGRPGRSPVYKAISGAIWVLTVCVYLLISFATGAWHITWMIFLIGTALDNIIKAIFDLRR